MWSRPCVRFILCGLVFFWIAGAARGAAVDAELVALDVKVTAATEEKVIGNASVYVSFKEGRWLLKDKKRAWHAKTNGQGLARFPGIPPGKVLIQVVAEGWKTFGKYYDLGKEPEQKREVVEIKLERPRRWY